MELRSDPEMLLEEAEQMAAAGHPQEELRLLNRLLQVSPENPDAYIRLARALLRAGDAQSAGHATELMAALPQSEFDGDYVNVLFMIGNIHKIQADDRKAKECWSEAYKVFHTDVLGTLPQVTAITSYVVMDSPKDERA